MRLFVAIDMDTEGYLKQIQQQITGARLSFPNTFHLTLKFLGETDKVEDIKKRLKEVKFEKFTLEIDKIGFFDNENYIRVIWLGVKQGDKVKELQEEVEQVLGEFGLKNDLKFHPHITLARVRSVDNKSEFLDRLKRIRFEQKEFEIKEFKLVRSKLTSKGPVYEDILIIHL